MTPTPIETHEKNLAWIDERMNALTNGGSLILDLSSMRHDFYRSLQTNRKTLERHGPDEWGECRCCVDGQENGIKFPCPTYTDVRDGLGISE